MNLNVTAICVQIVVECWACIQDVYSMHQVFQLCSKPTKTPIKQSKLTGFCSLPTILNECNQCKPTLLQKGHFYNILDSFNIFAISMFPVILPSSHCRQTAWLLSLTLTLHLMYIVIWIFTQILLLSMILKTHQESVIMRRSGWAWDLNILLKKKLPVCKKESLSKWLVTRRRA